MAVATANNKRKAVDPTDDNVEKKHKVDPVLRNTTTMNDVVAALKRKETKTFSDRWFDVFGLAIQTTVNDDQWKQWVSDVQQKRLVFEQKRCADAHVLGHLSGELLECSCWQSDREANIQTLIDAVVSVMTDNDILAREIKNAITNECHSLALALIKKRKDVRDLLVLELSVVHDQHGLLSDILRLLSEKTIRVNGRDAEAAIVQAYHRKNAVAVATLSAGSRFASHLDPNCKVAIYKTDTKTITASIASALATVAGSSQTERDKCTSLYHRHIAFQRDAVKLVLAQALEPVDGFSSLLFDIVASFV